MSIFDMFRGGANPNAIQKQAGNNDPMNPQNPNLPQNQNTQQTQNQNTNTGGDGNPQNNQNNQKPNESPEVDYSKLWQTDPNQKGPADPAAFSFNIDQNKVNETFGQLDFTKAVTPELISKIQAGGQEAISATLAAMNVIAQQAVRTAVMGSAKLTETGIQTAGQRVKDFIPSVVREHQVSSVLREANPLMKDPAFAPLVDAATIQMSRQFPNATPEEVKDHVSKYFDTMAEKFVQRDGRQIVAQPKQVPQSVVQTDWSSEPV